MVWFHPDMVNNLLEEGGSAAMETTEDKIKRTLQEWHNKEEETY